MHSKRRHAKNDLSAQCSFGKEEDSDEEEANDVSLESQLTSLNEAKFLTEDEQEDSSNDQEDISNNQEDISNDQDLSNDQEDLSNDQEDDFPIFKINSKTRHQRINYAESTDGDEGIGSPETSESKSKSDKTSEFKIETQESDENNSVEAAPCKLTNGRRTYKDREVRSLLKAQGEDPSDMSKFNRGPDIYQNIKGRKRKGKVFYDEKPTSPDHSIVVLRRSSRLKKFIVEEELDEEVSDTSKEDDEIKDPSMCRGGYFFRQRKPTQTFVDRYESAGYNDTDFSLYSTRNEHRPMQRGSTRKPTAPTDNEEEMSIRCLPLNMTKNEFRQRSKRIVDIQQEGVDPTVTFESIGGMKSLIQKLKETINFPCLYNQFFTGSGIIPQRGLLFHGAPGTGKTLIARALANEFSRDGLKVAFFTLQASECLSRWFGESEQYIRRLFQQAVKCKPSIIFIDEIDGLAPTRSCGDTQNLHNTIVATLLDLMDGLKTCTGVLVIGATNRIGAIDIALRRPGRFDLEFEFPLPDKETRRHIFQIKTSSWKPGLSDKLLDWLANHTSGYSGADIMGVCTEAALHVLREMHPEIYKSEKQLDICVSNMINVERYHFKKAMRKMKSHSRKVNTTAVKPLPAQYQALYKQELNDILKKTAEVLPILNKRSKMLQETNKDIPLYERICNSESEEFLSSDEEDCPIRSFAVCRPRILIHGDEGCGVDEHLIPAFLNDVDGFSVHSVNSSTIYNTSLGVNMTGSNIIETISAAVESEPSIIYMPNVDRFYEHAPQSLVDIWEEAILKIPESAKILLLATSSVPRESMLPNLAYQMRKTVAQYYKMPKLTEKQQRELISPIFTRYLYRPPIIKSTRRKVSAQISTQKPPNPSESKQKILLKTQKFFLEHLDHLMESEQFKHFVAPVNLTEVPDYLSFVKTPMCLQQMKSRAERLGYLNVETYLADINLICSNCLLYNPETHPEDRKLRSAAIILQVYAASTLMKKLTEEFKEMFKWLATNISNHSDVRIDVDNEDSVGKSSSHLPVTESISNVSTESKTPKRHTKRGRYSKKGRPRKRKNIEKKTQVIIEGVEEAKIDGNEFSLQSINDEVNSQSSSKFPESLNQSSFGSDLSNGYENTVLPDMANLKEEPGFECFISNNSFAGTNSESSQNSTEDCTSERPAGLSSRETEQSNSSLTDNNNSKQTTAPKVIVNSIKVDQLLQLCLKNTANFTRVDLIFAFSRLSRLVAKHRSVLDKKELLEEIEQVIEEFKEEEEAEEPVDC